MSSWYSSRCPHIKCQVFLFFSSSSLLCLYSVTKILEGYGSLGKDDKRELILRDSKSKVTLRHLLTHTAGLAYYWNHVNMVEYYKPSQGQAYGILPFVTGEISDFASPAVKEAGVEMDYSPVTDWLGQVMPIA